MEGGKNKGISKWSSLTEREYITRQGSCLQDSLSLRGPGPGELVSISHGSDESMQGSCQPGLQSVLSGR